MLNLAVRKVAARFERLKAEYKYRLLPNPVSRIQHTKDGKPLMTVSPINAKN